MHLPCRVISRSLHASASCCKLLPHDLKGRGSSSQRWLTRQLNDPYVKKARYANYRARSAFKLIEMDERFCLLRPGMTVVECGAAPGAWTQVLVERLKAADPKSGSLIVSLDREALSPVVGAHTLPAADVTSPVTQARVLQLLQERRVHLFCSDMAPNASGVSSLDHEAIADLSLAALRFALPILAPKAAFLTKVWGGNRVPDLMALMRRFFASVRGVKPPASRSDSTEIYLLAQDFAGLQQRK